MGSETIRRKSGSDIKTGFTARDHIEHAGAGDAAEHLGHDVGQKFGRGKALAGVESNRNRRVEMTTRNVANRISHRQHRQTKRKGATEKANTHFREGGSNDGAATTSENQPEG